VSQRRSETSNDSTSIVFGRPLAYKNVVAIVYVVSLFLDILDTTIVNVAIPSLGREFRSDNAEWIVLGYTLSLAVWIPASGWIGDRFGTRRTFLFAFAAFIGGSALCATATSMAQLIAFRVVQGVGGGMLTPVGIAMLFRAFPPVERAKAATILMIPTLIAPASGPIIGGFLVTHVGWRWIFLINLPIGLAGFAFAWKHLREHREPTAGPFDVPGFVLSGSALALCVFALSEGPRAGWASPAVLLTATVGAVAAVATVIVETRRQHPMLALRLFRNRLFRQCNIVSGLTQASFIGLIFVMPLYLQQLRGIDAFHSGLVTFTQAAGVLLSTQLVGRVLYARIGPRRLMTFGLLAAAVTIVAFTRVSTTTSLPLLAGMMFVRGICMGFAFVPMQTASYATIAPADNGRASSLFSTQRQVGVSIGVAVIASVLASYTTLSRQPIGDAELARTLTGYRIAFGVAAAFALAASFAAWFIRDEDAAATRRLPAEPEPASSKQSAMEPAAAESAVMETAAIASSGAALPASVAGATQSRSAQPSESARPPGEEPR
jgi:EmrB/QacA subfamily drug resistance transporter